MSGRRCRWIGAFVAVVLALGALPVRAGVFGPAPATQAPSRWVVPIPGWNSVIRVDSIGHVVSASDVDNGTDTTVTGRLTSRNGSNGTAVWSKDYPTTRIRDLAVNNAGLIAVGGALDGPVAFLPAMTIGGGWSDGFVALISPTGNALWALDLGTYGTTLTVAIDGAGNVTASGAFDEDINFGGQTASAPPGYRTWLASWNAAGRLRWARTFTDASPVSFSAMTPLDNGDLLVGGSYSALGFTLDGHVLTGPYYGTNGFVARLSGGQGTAQWARSYTSDDGGGAAAASIIANDPSGQSTFTLVAAGSRSVDFGGGPIPWPGCGVFRGFLAAFNASTGAYMWSEGSCANIGDSFSAGALTPQRTGVVGISLDYGDAFGLMRPSGDTQWIGDGSHSTLLLSVDPADGAIAVIGGAGTMTSRGVAIHNTAVDSNGHVYAAARAVANGVTFGRAFASDTDFIAG